MSHQTPIRNPFMLMTHPEVVLAAVERSERLSQLNRHLCRPLDKPGPQVGGQQADAAAPAADEWSDSAD